MTSPSDPKLRIQFCCSHSSKKSDKTGFWIVDSGSNIHLVSDKMAPTFLQKYDFSADDIRFDSSDGEKGGALGYHKLPGGDVYRNAKDGPRILSVFLLILQGFDSYGIRHRAA